MSIQEASIYLLEQYYKDFPVFNPWLENVHQTQARQNGTFSMKSIGSQSNASTMGGGVNGNRDLGRSMRGFNDRYVVLFRYTIRSFDSTTREKKFIFLWISSINFL
jgi:hypothetical protein